MTNKAIESFNRQFSASQFTTNVDSLIEFLSQHPLVARKLTSHFMKIYLDERNDKQKGNIECSDL